MKKITLIIIGTLSAIAVTVVAVLVGVFFKISQIQEQNKE